MDYQTYSDQSVTHFNQDLVRLVVVDHFTPKMFDTVVRFVGQRDDGTHVVFGVDHRPAQDIFNAMYNTDDDIEVFVEDWQILSEEFAFEGTE